MSDKIETPDQVIAELRTMSAQFVHPKDTYFASMANTVEQLARRLEACRRYFEHCERVSLSAQHAVCESAEMRVRMALKREAMQLVITKESEIERLRAERDQLYRAVWELPEHEEIEATLDETICEIHNCNRLAAWIEEVIK